MEQAHQFTEEPAAAQEYVSSDELVRALASIESRQMGEAHDRVKIGEAIQQLGLDISPEQILAEVNAERIRRISESQHAAHSRRTLATVATIVVLFVMFIGLGRWLHGIRSAAQPVVAYSAVSGMGQEFDSLMQTFRTNSFDDGKVAFVRVMANGRKFTTDQVHEILSEMSFDPGRVDAAVILYPHITDKENVYKLFDTMSFDQGRKDLIARLGLDKSPSDGK